MEFASDEIHMKLFVHVTRNNDNVSVSAFCPAPSKLCLSIELRRFLLAAPSLF